jgi:DNA-directed RNA polymerase alpha subunit
LQGRQTKTLKQVGLEIGVTPERVRQIEAKAYRKLIARYIYYLENEVEFKEYLELKKIAEAKKISLQRQVEVSVGIEDETLLVKDLPLPTRTRNALLKAGYRTEASLLDTCYLDTDKFYDIRGVGEKGFEEIINYLAGRVETIKQNSTKAGEHQTPKPDGMVEKTTKENRLTN